MQDLINNIILKRCKGGTFITLFNSFQYYHGFIEEDCTIKERFLTFLEEIMLKGELKLAYRGEYLVGSVNEQINLLREAWPTYYNEDEPLYDIDNAWWYVSSPVGPVWVYENGETIWQYPA